MPSLYNMSLTPPKQERLLQRCRAMAVANAMDCLAEMGELARQRIMVQREDEEEGRLLCPKPRRISISHRTSVDAQRLSVQLLCSSRIPSLADVEAGSELMDIFLSKGVVGGDQGTCSPYFSGSPPMRAHNPLIHDVQFAQKRNALPISDVLKPSPPLKKPLPRSSYGGVTDPLVRIEGFAASSSPDT